MIILHNFHHVWISVTRYVYPILYIYISHICRSVYFICFLIHLIIILYIYILALWPIYISKPSKLYMYLFVTICRYPLLYIYIYHIVCRISVMIHHLSGNILSYLLLIMFFLFYSLYWWQVFWYYYITLSICLYIYTLLYPYYSSSITLCIYLYQLHLLQ